VDVDDYGWLNKYKWHTTLSTRTYYAAHGSHQSKSGKQKFIWMHRKILKAPDNFTVDHINHNGLDNRKANLRLATRSQSSCNRRKTATPTSSRYKGVSWRICDKCWAAEIAINGTCKFLGRFRDEVDAAKAYDAAARKYHCQFAVVNFD